MVVVVWHAFWPPRLTHPVLFFWILLDSLGLSLDSFFSLFSLDGASLCLVPPRCFTGTHAMGGSRGGHMMAAVWSTLLHMGSDGYDKEARLVHRTFQKILKGIVPIEGYVFERL